MARCKEALMEHAYVVTLGAALAVVAATGMYTGHLRAENSVQIEAAANAMEITETLAPSRQPEITPLPTIAPLAVQPIRLRAGGETVYPLSGEVIRGHHADEPVYWEALSCFQVHMGVDIAGRAQEDVLCVMDGVVERVWTDALWGWQAEIAQMDQSVARYAGLAYCALDEGQAVTRGQVIGALLEEIPCEAEMGAHVHLEIRRDGEWEDPAALLARAARR